MGELEWFDAYCKLDNAPGAAEETLGLIRKAESDAARKGVVGIRDYEMAENVDTWTRRFSAASPRPRDANDSAWTGIDWDGSFTHGIRGLRVEAGVYPERLEDAIEAGWKTGVELPGSDGLSHVGTMKMISDGLAEHPFGVLLDAVFRYIPRLLRHAQLRTRPDRDVFPRGDMPWVRHRVPCHRR